MALEFCETLRPLAFRRNYGFSFCFMVLGNRATDYDIRPHADSLDDGAQWFVYRSAIEIFKPFPLVAGWNDPLRHRSRLRESPSLVSTSACADRGRVCWRCLRIYQIENLLFAGCDTNTVDPACGFVRSSCLSLCAAALRIVRRSTSRRRLGVTQNHSARCIDCCRRHWRSDDILLCAAKGLALPRERCDLRRQSRRQS